jgi:hypothetical protein
LFHSAKHSEKTLKREELTDIERLLITNDPGVLQTCLNAIDYERTSQKNNVFIAVLHFSHSSILNKEHTSSNLKMSVKTLQLGDN